MSSMKIEPDSKGDRILKAASACFGQYGFKRTAMNDIAEGAGISRAALYLLFQNKEDIFRTLSAHLHGRAIERAEAVLQAESGFRDSPQATLRERLIAAFEGKDLEIFELVYASPHGSELIDLSHAIGAEIFQTAEKRFAELLTAAIVRAEARGEIELSRVNLQPDLCANLLIGCTYGLKKSSFSIAEYRQRLRYLISIFDLALTASANDPKID
jgi:AcrR family transcriptional regulator